MNAPAMAAAGLASPSTTRHALDLPESTAAALVDLAREEGAGLRDVLGAMVGLLGRRYTRQDEIAAGAVSIGLADPCTFRSLLAQARAAAATGDPPASSGLWRPQTAATMLVPDVITAQLPPPAAYAGALDPDEAAGDRATAAMALTCAIDAGRWRLGLEHRSDLFDAGAVIRVSEHLVRLTTGAAAGPDVAVGRLAMLSDAEWSSVAGPWNPPDGGDAGACVQEVFEAQVARTPAAPALVCGDRTIAFDELNARANRLARRLRARDVRPEVLVGVCLVDPVETTVALLAVLKAGGAYVPLNSSHPRQRIEEIVADSGLALILTSEALRERCPLPDDRVLCLDQMAAELAAADASNVERDAVPGSAAYITYTSGSTGAPKGVVGVHRAITGAVRWSTPFVPDEVCCLNVSMSFASAVLGLFLPLLRGRPTVIIPEAQARDLPQLVSAWAAARVTRLVLVAPQLRQLLALGPEATSRLRHVTTVALSGATLSPDLAVAFFKAFPQARLINAYISTEVAIAATRLEMTRESVIRGTSIGRATANARVHILDRDFNPVPLGVRGEIFVETLDGARGYLHRPDLTAERFVPNPFASDARGCRRLYRTGDLGHRLPNGEIEYLGRTDHQLKIRGIRIEPGEVEAALEAHEDVTGAVVVGHGAEGQRRLVAYVAGQRGARPNTTELRRFLESRLPAYLVPATFVVLDELPLTPRGKVDRKALPAPGTIRPDLETPYVPPRTPLERQMAEIWSRVLRVDPVGVDDRFLDLGGDSLTAVQLVTELRDQLGLDVSVLQLLDRPTVAQLAEAAAGHQTGGRHAHRD